MDRVELEPVDATAVVVNTNDGPKLGRLVDVLQPLVRRVVVVDNGSTDGSLTPVEGRTGVTVIRNGTNLGFAAAANSGAALATGEWILFVNPDIHLRPELVRRLLAEVPPDAAAVAPLQVDEAGRPRPETGGYHPSLLRYAVWAVLPSSLHRRRGPWLANPFPRGDAELSWVSGALAGIRTEVFRQLGGFDTRFFLYQEDVDFGKRARDAGYRVLCRGSLELRHDVSHGDPRRRATQARWWVRSLSLQFPSRRRRLLGLILGLGFGLRALLGSGAQRTLARAVLPLCAALVKGRIPS